MKNDAQHGLELAREAAARAVLRDGRRPAGEAPVPKGRDERRDVPAERVVEGAGPQRRARLRQLGERGRVVAGPGLRGGRGDERRRARGGRGGVEDGDGHGEGRGHARAGLDAFGEAEGLAADGRGRIDGVAVDVEADVER